ncbi:hypothetical protein C8R42DRAFT_725909 [Lentinula raphanica]|nr:hypothetical protein C8R42DRAFT_725909 [Lentinula raphanica]
MPKPQKMLQKVSFSSIFANPVNMDELSRDGRRIKRKAAQAVVPLPVNKKQREGEIDSTPGMDFVSSILDAFTNSEYCYVPDSSKVINVADLINTAAVKMRRRYLTSDQPLLEWKAHADEYLAEMIRNEGRGDSLIAKCFLCKRDGDDAAPLFRCMDCFSKNLVCEDCCRTRHEDRPLDVVERWNGSFFENVALRDIGVTIQLGHQAGESCLNPRIVQDFTVIHTNGIHTVHLSFCNCPNRALAGEWYQQLMRCRWFPATHLEPRTAATYRVMDTFHVLTLQGKVTTYDFYAGLEKLTDNTGVKNIKDRYKAFSRMMKEWRHLKMAKRAGRGNDATRTLAETRAGEMGISCIACPRPGINLPENWKEAFDNADLDEKMSTCTGLSALDHANTKFSRGYATTGVGLGVCARHEFIQRNGVVDLQKGERYANMDYAFGSFLRHHDPALTKVVSYDIACQWHKNLVRRVRSLPSLVSWDLSLQKIFFAIPKLHIHGHQLSCQLNFSLNWLWGAGRTDGEGVERPWAHLGPIASSTRDMGPGSRHGTMNDHFGHWNWVKLTGLGSLLLKRYRIAIQELDIHREGLTEFTEGKGSDTVRWEKMIRDWEAELDKPEKDRDKSVVNPYEVPRTGLMENDVRLHLTQAEAQEAADGSFGIHDVGPTAFISQLLELEDQQRILKLDIKDKTFETAAQKTDLTERRTKMMRLMGRLRSIQALYMPAAITYLSNRQTNDKQPEHVEDIPIVFPSTLPATERTSGCRAGLTSIEEQLREAQLRVALNSLRNHLHMKFRLLTYRKTNVKAQGMITKSQALLKRNQRQIECDTRKYRAAWKALEELRGIGESGWRKLHHADVRMMGNDDNTALGMERKRPGKRTLAKEAASNMAKPTHTDADGSSDDGYSSSDGVQERGGTTMEVARDSLAQVRRQVGEGFRETSWIWKEGGTGSLVDQDTLDEFVRVEWCKTHARARRWMEEVSLLVEERRRVLITLEYNANEWEGRAEYEGPLSEGKGEAHKEGARAYALLQASVFRALARSFTELWTGVVGVDEAGEQEEDGDGASADEEEEDAEVLGMDEEADIPDGI